MAIDLDDLEFPTTVEEAKRWLLDPENRNFEECRTLGYRDRKGWKPFEDLLESVTGCTIRHVRTYCLYPVFDQLLGKAADFDLRLDMDLCGVCIEPCAGEVLETMNGLSWRSESVDWIVAAIHAYWQRAVYLWKEANYYNKRVG